ncbi:hypothetical protein NBRC116601_18210 [Cognatishimia sp. WU-CL00825]
MHVQGFSADNVIALWNLEYPKHIAGLEKLRDKHGIEDLHTEIVEQKGLSLRNGLAPVRLSLKAWDRLTAPPLTPVLGHKPGHSGARCGPWRLILQCQ